MQHINIYSSPFRSIHFQKEMTIFYDNWFPESSKMTPEEHGKENLSLVEMVAQYMPKYYLLDLREYWYDLNEKDKNEVLLNSNLLLDLGIKKIALIANTSLEQFDVIQKLKKENKRLNENNIQFFQDIITAEMWLQ